MHTNISLVKIDLTRLVFWLNVLASRACRSKGRWNLRNAVKLIYVEAVKFLGEICDANLSNLSQTMTKNYAVE